MEQVHKNLYVGDVNDASNDKKQKQNNIEYILNVSGSGPERESAPGYGTIKNQNYFHIPLEDGTGNSDFLIKQAIQQGRKLHKKAMEEDTAVLIHCAVGSSRSVTIAASLMSLENKQRVFENVERIKQVRPIANPVDGLVEQANRITSELYNE